MALRALLAGLVVAGVLAGCSHSHTELALHHLTVDNTRRSYYEFRPTTLAHDRQPALILLHGYGGKPLDLVQSTGLEAESRADGFVMVAPVGISNGWNAGSCCGASRANDVAFIASLAGALARDPHVDPTRVYAVGFSNGGMLAYSVGCRLPGVIAGVAVVEGTMTDACPTHDPVDLLVIHQLGDTVVPYAGAAKPEPVLLVRGPFPSIPDSIGAWEHTEGCDHPRLISPLPRAVVNCPGGDRVELMVLPGGSHVWPPVATSELAAFFGLTP